MSMEDKIKLKDKDKRIRHQAFLLKKYIKDYESLAKQLAIDYKAYAINAFFTELHCSDHKSQ